MLVLTRKIQERIKIGDNVTITILRVKGNAVRIGIEAPREVRVVRAELPTGGEPATNVTAAESGEEDADVPAVPSASKVPSTSDGAGCMSAAESDSPPNGSPLRYPQRRMTNRCGAPPLRMARSQALAASGIMS